MCILLLFSLGSDDALVTHTNGICEADVVEND